MGKSLYCDTDDEVLQTGSLQETIYEREKSPDKLINYGYGTYYNHEIKIRTNYEENAAHRLIRKRLILPEDATKGVSVELTNGDLFYLPIELSYIKDTIVESKEILNLQPGWDDCNAYQILPEVWDNAIMLLINYSNKVFDSFKIKIQAPDINPCRDGSIDLEWRTKTARLLINVSNKELASYYGDNFDSINGIGGFVKLKQVQEFLSTWMKFLV